MRAGILRTAAWGVLLAAVGAQAELPQVTVQVADQRLKAEVAVSPAERARGLAGRDRLAADRAMLFVWPHPGPRRFWMKGTRIPLSVAFLDPQGRILNIHRMSPPPPDRRNADGWPADGYRRYPSRGPARFALETNRGWFRRHGITPGDRVRFRLPPGMAGPEAIVVGPSGGP
jgi:hypothetical protein